MRDPSDPEAISEKALEYLANIPDYGEIMTETPDFPVMENLSYNVVSAPRSPGLEGLTVATAYMAGKAKDADEAKTLVSYVRSAKTAPLPTSVPDSIRKLASGFGPTASLEQIMKESRCGIMTARIIQTCIRCR